MMNSDVTKRMDKVVFNWFAHDAMLFQTWTMLDKYPSTDIRTIGIYTKTTLPHIKYNPEFIKALNDEHLEFVMTSEALKMLLRHCTTRFLDPAFASNASSKMVLNKLLNSYSSNDKSVEELFKDFEVDKDDIETFEDGYREIIDNLPDIDTDQLKKKYQQKSSGSTSEDGSAEGSGEGEDGEESNEEGGFKDSRDALDAYKDPFNEGADGWGENSEFDSNVSDVINNAKSSKPGSVTGGIMSEILASMQSGVNYRSILSLFGTSIMKEKSITSRMKRNRRYGLERPGFRNKEISRMLVCLDVSGSMSDDDLSEGFNMINHCCRHSQLDFLEFDTEIKHIEKNLKKGRTKYTVHGRGGTDADLVFRYAEKYKYDGIIVFTDGYLSVPTPPKNKIKTLWLITEKNNTTKFFGQQVYLDRFFKK